MKFTHAASIDLTPADLADMFCDFCGDEQAEFFTRIWQNAKAWPGAGWCSQSCDIVKHSDKDAIEAIRTIASHLPPQ